MHDRPPGGHHHQEIHVKQFMCGDVIPGCRNLFHGTEEEIFDAVAVHASTEHHLAIGPNLLRAQVRDHIVAAA